MASLEVSASECPDTPAVLAAWTEAIYRIQCEASTTLATNSVPNQDALGFALTQLGEAGPTLAPAQVREHVLTFIDAWAELLQRQFSPCAASPAAQSLIEPAPGDRRFRDPRWNESPYDFIKQSYLLQSRLFTALFAPNSLGERSDADHGSGAARRMAVRQIVDACSPSNFLFTNPVAVDEARRSGGRSLLRGLHNLGADLARANIDGVFRITSGSADDFTVGEDLAATTGKVVYRNELMELVRYAPRTEQVFEHPLLVVPSWVNKYYVLDLRPENSFVRWAVDQGHTVFLISWRNPDASLAGKQFDDYLVQGPLAALTEIERLTARVGVNAVGYCLGGTLLACTLAYLAQTDSALTENHIGNHIGGQPRTRVGATRVVSATYLAALVDFSDPGDIRAYLNPQTVKALRRRMETVGYLDGRILGDTFSAMRANDLIWHFFVNKYLCGHSPEPFDLLYWNADVTNMPRAMHSFFLTELYQRDRLRVAGGVVLAGRALDLAQITTPSYIVGARDDHISPWRSTYAAGRLYGGPVRFVLGESGHVAGIVNPPAASRYGHWSDGASLSTESLPLELRSKVSPGERQRTHSGGRAGYPDADAWIEGARWVKTSWWSDWGAWIAEHAGAKIPARSVALAPQTTLGDAPGSYVMVRV